MGVGETILEIFKILCLTFIAICLIYSKFFKGDDK